MKRLVQKCFYNIDPCLVISVISLIVIVPIGFTIDYVHLEENCNCGPELYLPIDENNSSIPFPFIEFVNDSREKIELVVSSVYPKSFYLKWVETLKSAHSRNVVISIVTDDERFIQSLDFCDITFINNTDGRDKLKMLVFFAQSDHKRTIYASRLFHDWKNISLSNFFISFKDCESLAHDASSLFQLLKFYAEKGVPKLFLKKFLPGSSFPLVHKWNEGSCSFGIAPLSLTPPGRLSVYELLKQFFQNSCSNLSILTPSLFPSVEEVHKEMPELLLSEQIEQSAFLGSTIRIVLTDDVLINNSELNSLQHFPNVDIKGYNMLYSPTFYLHGNECGFMPIPFQQVISNSMITFSMTIADKNVTNKLRNHFNSLWNLKP